MRRSTKEFIKICSERLPLLEPVYEFRFAHVSSEEDSAALKECFAGRKYERALLEIDGSSIPSASVETALVIDSFEHAEYKRKVIDELYRVLKPDGVLIISSYMEHPIHDEPHDYWRFTPEAFKSLLKPFASSFVDFAGKDYFPHSVVGIGFKGAAPEGAMDQFTKEFELWKKYWSHPKRCKKGFFAKLFKR
jgi:SAM-dependent methyltransferase